MNACFLPRQFLGVADGQLSFILPRRVCHQSSDPALVKSLVGLGVTPANSFVSVYVRLSCASKFGGFVPRNRRKCSIENAIAWSVKSSTSAA